MCRKILKGWRITKQSNWWVGQGNCAKTLTRNIHLFIRRIQPLMDVVTFYGLERRSTRTQPHATQCSTVTKPLIDLPAVREHRPGWLNGMRKENSRKVMSLFMKASLDPNSLAALKK